MISWIQTAFQKHFRIIFLVLLAIIIVSFVFTIGAAPGIGQADRGQLSRMFYGVNLGSPEETERLFGDANLSVMLQAGFPALDEARLQEYAFQRHAALHLAKSLNLPRPAGDELTDHIRGLRMFSGASGEFDPQAYSRFRDSLKNNPRFSEADLARVLADDVQYQRVQTILGGPGYVLDRDVQEQIDRMDTTWQVNVASVDYTSFNPNINPSDEELRAYFDANAFRYEVPPQVRVRYIDFPAAAFVEKVQLTDADVRAYYDSNPSRFPNPAKANTDQSAAPVSTDTDPDADFQAVRAQVEAVLRQERARRLATQAASDLTVALFDAGATSANVEELLSSRGLTLQSAPPFARNRAPAFLGGNAQHAAEAFRLSEDRPISDALNTPNGAVVLVWQETLPAHAAEFASVKEDVRRDYLESQRRQRFATLGRTMKQAIADRVSRGESFRDAAAAVAQANNVTLETNAFGPFARREPPQEISPTALSALETLDNGQVSDLLISGDQGLLVHVASKEAPAVAPSDGRFAEVRSRMATTLASSNASEILHDMVEKELARFEPAAR